MSNWCDDEVSIFAFYAVLCARSFFCPFLFCPTVLTRDNRWTKHGGRTKKREKRPPAQRFPSLPITFTLWLHSLPLTPPFTHQRLAQNRFRTLTGKEGGRCCRTKKQGGWGWEEKKECSVEMDTNTEGEQREKGERAREGEEIAKSDCSTAKKKKNRFRTKIHCTSWKQQIYLPKPERARV